jgi:fatty-acyl-CoA synthase
MKWLKRLLVQWLLRRFSVPRDAVRFAWKRYPQRTALITPSRTLSYRQLQARTMRIVSAFSAHGLKKGDICYLQVGDACDLVEVNLAALESGVVLAGIQPAADEQLLARLSQTIPPKGLLLHSGADQIATVLRRLVPGIALLALDQLTEAPPPSTYVPVPIAARDLAVIGFTSGTTGPPKMLAGYHGTFLDSLRLLMANVQLDIPKTPDMTLAGIPMAGAGSGLMLPTFLSGGTLLVPSQYRAEEFLRLIAEHRVTRLFTTPSLLIDMLDHPDLDRYPLTSLRNVIYGTEWMPAQKIDEALRRFGPILQQGYGSAEVLPPVSMLQPHEHWRDGKIAPRSVLSSVGRVVPQVQVIIADEDDGPLPQGEIGHILIKSPTQFTGYLHQPELTAQVLRGGWLHIGDMGYFDAEGLLHVLGRGPDVIRRGSHATYPRQVEEILHDHPAVKETAYVQVGERAIMALSLRHAWRSRWQDPAMNQELIEFLAQRVCVEDRPDSLRLLDGLPRSPLGKVLRRDVRALLSA